MEQSDKAAREARQLAMYAAPDLSPIPERVPARAAAFGQGAAAEVVTEEETAEAILQHFEHARYLELLQQREEYIE